MGLLIDSIEVQRGNTLQDFRGDDWVFVRGDSSNVTVHKKGDTFERSFFTTVFPALVFRQTAADDAADANQALSRKYGPFRFHVVGAKVTLHRNEGAEGAINIYADEFDKLQTCLDAALEALEAAQEDFR